MYETAKAVIGMIVMGASAAVESEFHKNVPDHIQIATTRVPIGEVSYDGLKTMTNALPDAARLLMETCPDMIIVTNMTGSCIRGAEIVNLLQQTTGIPVLAPPFEFVRLLRSIGAEKIAIASSFDRELNLAESMFFENHGFQVSRILPAQTYFGKDPFSLGQINYPELKAAMEHQDYSDIDAVIFDHPVMNLHTGIEKHLEQIIAVPFFSINQVLLYSALQRVHEPADHLFISKFLKGGTA